jgi:very-short-patch-repair endonuclease
MKDGISNKLRDNLLDREKALALARYFVDKVFSDEDAKDQRLVVLKEWQNILASKSIEHIHANAESPIEKVFMTSLALNAIKNCLTLVFTPKFDSVSEAVEFYRKVDEVATKLRQEYKNKFPESGITDFLNWIEQLDGPSEDEKREIYVQATIYQDYFDLKNAFHITPQASFKEIKVNDSYVRPDFYVWIPSNPKFNLVVECDGFKYHSSKNSFSRDRARDRLLQSKGFQVFRFSGSEIWTDPVGITKGLLEYLLTQNHHFRNGG